MECARKDSHCDGEVTFRRGPLDEMIGPYCRDHYEIQYELDWEWYLEQQYEKQRERQFA